MSYGVRVLGSLRLAAGRVRQCPRSSASARKSSTTRQWSTPLARNIAEVIQVNIQSLYFEIVLIGLDYRADLNCGLYAPMPYFTRRRLLHDQESRPGSIRADGGFYNLTGNFTSLWRAHWNMVSGRMDCTGQKERRSGDCRSWPGQRDFDG